MNEDESDGSSQPDEDGSEDGETDDHSQEDYTLSDEQLERRTTSTGAQRNNLAPQSMQWAIRHRDTNRSSVRLSSGSSLVFIDPSALRRTTAASAAVAAAQEPHTMSTTASSLARAFGIVLRQVCQLFNTITELYTSGLLHNMNITYQEANQLHVSTANPHVVFVIYILYIVIMLRQPQRQLRNHNKMECLKDIKQTQIICGFRMAQNKSFSK